jgi:dCMP deaminase
MTEKTSRPSWDEYFLNLIDVIGTRATCDRGKAGCVIVKEKRILTTGYVGSPIGAKHCDEVGHEMQSVIHEDGSQTRHCIRTAHAEQNAIANAARFGVSLEGATLYCKMTPCYVCAKMIINAGVKRVVCAKDYHASKRTKEIFEESEIDYVLISEDVQKYDDM